MLTFVASSIEFADIEESIMNSESFYNRISKNKEKLSKEEIAEQIKNAETIGAERFLIKHDHEYVGILEYLPCNPKDQCTWLGLLLIKKEFQAQGYGSKSLQKFDELMKEKRIAKYRIGVISENVPAHRFWTKHGFIKVDSTMKDHKEIIIYEKKLLNGEGV